MMPHRAPIAWRDQRHGAKLADPGHATGAARQKLSELTQCAAPIAARSPRGMGALLDALRWTRQRKPLKTRRYVSVRR
jgi:hypothetical protein